MFILRIRTAQKSVFRPDHISMLAANIVLVYFISQKPMTDPQGTGTTMG